MGLYLKTLLFAFLKFSIIHGEILCPASFCGSSMLRVQYPFKFETQTPTNNCTYFNLTCNITQSTTILNLPHAGDFYVQNIDYVTGYIQLYDPGNCLMRRLMNFSLESSPFKATYYGNYTLYVCPLDSHVLISPIGCLTNSTSITIATRELSREFMDDYGCRGIGSWLLPVQNDGIYDDPFLYLTWDANVCIDCEGSDDHESGKWGAGPITRIVAVALSMPALIIIALSCCSVFCLHLIKMIGDKYEADSAAAAAPPNTTLMPQTTIITALPLPSTTNSTGLDESKILACTEMVVLSESDEGIPSANSNMCSICLENYCRKERISLISKCGHCFHANCIQQWLGKNSTCPVCRTSLSDVAL